MTAGLSDAAVRWLVYGEQGISSEAMFHWLVLGHRPQHNYPRPQHNYPRDPDDFRRCEMLLRVIPELREQLPLMAEIDAVWAGLVERWDEIADLLEQECPGVYDSHVVGHAPRCYDLMSEIIRLGREAR